MLVAILVQRRLLRGRNSSGPPMTLGRIETLTATSAATLWRGKLRARGGRDRRNFAPCSFEHPAGAGAAQPLERKRDDARRSQRGTPSRWGTCLSGHDAA